MIYTPMTRKAMKIAYKAHHGQEDKAGVPYIFHPIHLAEQMDDEISVCVALLHDVAEDTAVTIEELEKEFPPQVTEAVKVLTHKKEDSYFEYIKKIKNNKIAVKVKLADLEHNSDRTRITSCGPEILEKAAGRMEKYKKAREILLEK